MRTRSSPARKWATWSRLGLGLLLGGVAAAAARAAGLTWISDSLYATAGPEQAAVHLEFPFVNRSDRAITITSVTPGCGCTNAFSDRSTYAPGDAGTVQAIFTVGDRTGLQDKVIAVRTDAPGEEEPKELSLHIRVAAYLSFAPHAVFWKIGEAPVEKTILCSAEQANAITLAAANPDDAAIIARIETLKPGRRYRLHLRPTSTARSLSVPVRLHFEIAGAKPRIFDAFAYVEPGVGDRR